MWNTEYDRGRIVEVERSTGGSLIPLIFAGIAWVVVYVALMSAHLIKLLWRFVRRQIIAHRQRQHEQQQILNPQRASHQPADERVWR